MNREFTEIVIMNSCENLQKDFITYLNIRNLNISKGGRFHHISSKFNKFMFEFTTNAFRGDDLANFII